MIHVSFDNETSFPLVAPIIAYPHRIALYFSRNCDNIDYSHGFSKWEVDEATGNHSVIQEFSSYKYKWNVLTSIDNGIVLTDDPKYVEKEEDHFHPLSKSDIQEMNLFCTKSAAQDDRENLIPSLEQRISDLEKCMTTLCSLIQKQPPYIEERDMMSISKIEAKIIYNMLASGELKYSQVPEDVKEDVDVMISENNAECLMKDSDNSVGD